MKIPRCPLVLNLWAFLSCSGMAVSCLLVAGPPFRHRAIAFGLNAAAAILNGLIVYSRLRAIEEGRE